MLRRLPLGALLAAAVIAVAGWTLAPGGGDPATDPAPPPATCRVGPTASGWDDFRNDPASKDLTPFQDYREALGMGPGTRGDGVTLADVEYDWLQTHVELAGRGLPAPPQNRLPASYRASDHGTAVLAMLGGNPDGQGITGVVVGAEIRPFSPYATGAYDPARAIEAAARVLGPGDVLLIELQAQPSSGGPYLPIEVFDTAEQPIRTLIADAVRKGVVVVEPAGNGNVDIGTVGTPWLRGSDDPRYSGALIVGAGGSAAYGDGSSDLRWVPSSNYGARVDVQGVGVAVVTAGYGNGPDPIGGSGDRAYTACFDGTSSAGATVAAAVVALQSAAMAQGRAPLTPDQVRAVLRQTGASQQGSTDRPIGPRPQVAAAIASLDGVPPPGASRVPGVSGPVGPGTGPVLPVISGTADRPPRPAASRITVRYAKAGGRLTISLRGLAKGARVTVGGRPGKVVRGRVTLRGVRPGRLVMTVTPPARLKGVYRAVRAVVVIAPSGTARLIRR